MHLWSELADRSSVSFKQKERKLGQEGDPEHPSQAGGTQEGCCWHTGARAGQKADIITVWLRIPLQDSGD